MFIIVYVSLGILPVTTLVNKKIMCKEDIIKIEIK